jgi:hypothetical protein
MKKEKTIEVFCEEPNFAVVRIPSRKFPGVVIQGDSLLDLVGTAKEVIDLLADDVEEAKGALAYLHDELNWRLEWYQKVMKDNGSPLF